MPMDPSEYDRLFGSLNENQTRALTTTNDSVLQIVAGPGTGKTKLLISRVAYLILNFHLPPAGIIITTFTKKAANEMKERLDTLLDGHKDIDVSNIQIGTFHSICFGYLRFYGKYIGLENFSIADTKDQKDLVKDALKKLDMDEIKDDKDGVKRLLAYITNKKSMGQHPEDIVIKDPTDRREAQSYQGYAEYQTLLAKNAKIDFDDILVFTYKLLKKRPNCVAHVKHILVDEFQDTNSIQLELIFLFSQFCNDNITIVGDADQSIYGFRNASYENFNKIEARAIHNHRNFIRITLDQNYRSTASILRVSESLMRHQNGREDKVLVSNSDKNIPVYYINHNFPAAEPIFIARTILNLMNDEVKPYKPKEIAIIARASRIFLSLERELTKRGIRYKITKGHSFWELKEVTMAMDCLRIIANDDWISYKRVFEWAVVSCGPKLLEKIESVILNHESNEIPNGFVHKTLTRFVTGEIPGMGAKAKASFIHLLAIIDDSRKLLKVKSPSSLYNSVLVKFDIIESALKKKTSRTKDVDEKRADIKENLFELQDQFETYNPVDDDLLRQAQENIFAEQEKNNTNDETLSKTGQQAQSPQEQLSNLLPPPSFTEKSPNKPKAKPEKSKKTKPKVEPPKKPEKPKFTLDSFFNKSTTSPGNPIVIKTEPDDEHIEIIIERKVESKIEPLDDNAKAYMPLTPIQSGEYIQLEIDPSTIPSNEQTTPPQIPRAQTAPRLSISEQKEKFLRDFLEHIHLAETIAAEDPDDKTDENGRVTLTTIHGSKGLEWSVVFLPSLINGIIPSIYTLNEQTLEKKELAINEERRCFYVALTRGKYLLYLSTYHDDNEHFPVVPSCFLDEIPEDCYTKLNESTVAEPHGADKVFGKLPLDKIRRLKTPSLSTFEKSLRKEIVGSNGTTYNPVTGATNDDFGNPPPKKKKRLGMGRPKQMLPLPKK